MKQKVKTAQTLILLLLAALTLKSWFIDGRKESDINQPDNSQRIESLKKIVSGEASPSTTKDFRLFSCTFGRCPEYVGSVDFQGNGGHYTVVIIPTAMTKGAGKAIVIDDETGAIAYESGEYPQIDAKIIYPTSKNDLKQKLSVSFSTDIYTSQSSKIVVSYVDSKWVESRAE